MKFAFLVMELDSIERTITRRQLQVSACAICGTHSLSAPSDLDCFVEEPGLIAECCLRPAGWRGGYLMALIQLHSFVQQLTPGPCLRQVNESEAEVRLFAIVENRLRRKKVLKTCELFRGSSAVRR